MMSNVAKFKCGYVSIIGRPNVGKSTLLNHLVGQKISITSSKPQTTRWRLSGIKTTPGYQIIYIDTPGLQYKYDSAINRHMRREIMNSILGVDILVLVVDTLTWNDADQHLLELIGKTNCPVVLVINKIDKLKQKEKLLPYIDRLSGIYEFQDIVPASALKNKNIKEIEKTIVSCLPASGPEFSEDQLTDRNQRFLAAEFIREKIIRMMGQELPYKISVTIDNFSELPGIINIDASIWVESDSHKKIVIGKKGGNLKTAGEKSRKDMEELFGKKVYLQMWVKIRKKWTADEKALKQFGYEL